MFPNELTEDLGNILACALRKGTDASTAFASVYENLQQAHAALKFRNFSSESTSQLAPGKATVQCICAGQAPVGQTDFQDHDFAIMLAGPADDTAQHPDPSWCPHLS